MTGPNKIGEISLLGPVRLRRIVPIEPPRYLKPQTRLEDLEKGAEHLLWIQQNAGKLVRGLVDEMIAFLVRNPLPEGMKVFLTCTYEDNGERRLIDRPSAQAGYRVRVIAEQADAKIKICVNTCYYVEGIQKNAQLMRLLILTSQIEHFSHLEVKGDKTEVVLRTPSKLGEVPLLPRREALKDPRVDQLAIIPVAGQMGGENMQAIQIPTVEVGAEPVQIPMLLLPSVVRRYIDENVVLQEALRRAFGWQFGQGRGSDYPTSSKVSFYAWWEQMWGCEKGGADIQRLELFAANADPHPLIPWDDKTRTPAVSARTIALRTSQMSLAARRMRAFVQVRRVIRDLHQPTWAAYDRYLQTLFGEEDYQRIKEIVLKYNLAQAISVYKLFAERGETDRLKNRRPELVENLRSFNNDFLGEDEALLFTMTGSALETRIIQFLIDRCFERPIPFAKIDQALERGGLPPSTSITPQTLVQEALEKWDATTSYRYYINQAAMGITLDVFLFFMLTIPAKPEFENDIVEDMILELFIAYNKDFQSEFETRDNLKSVYYLWPKELSKQEAVEQRVLFKLQIDNELGLGQVRLFSSVTI